MRRPAAARRSASAVASGQLSEPSMTVNGSGESKFRVTEIVSLAGPSPIVAEKRVTFAMCYRRSTTLNSLDGGCGVAGAV